MANKKLAHLIKQEVTRSDPTTKETSAIVTTQNAPLTETKPNEETLFDESKRIWDEFVAFDKEHQLTQRVSLQLLRLTKAVGKPVLVLSLRGTQVAVVTFANADKRAALVERFTQSPSAKAADASLDVSKD